MNQSRAIILAGILVTLAVLAHAVLPRYEVHHVIGGLVMRVDRWTGRAELDSLMKPGSAWLTRGAMDVKQPSADPFSEALDGVRAK